MSQISPKKSFIHKKDDQKWFTFRRTSISNQANSKPFNFSKAARRLSMPAPKIANSASESVELPFPLRAILQINDTLLFREVIVLKNETLFNETQIGYYICDEKGDRLFYVVHETANLFAAFNALITVDSENYVIKLNGKSVWASLIFNQCLQIESPPGNQIGRVLIKFASKSEYHVYDSETDSKRPLFIIKPKEANYLKSNLDHFLYAADIERRTNESGHVDKNDKDGQELGLITKNIDLLTNHHLKRGMHFGINFPQRLPIKSKALLMCAALLIHIHRFQRNYR